LYGNVSLHDHLKLSWRASSCCIVGAKEILYDVIVNKA